MKQSRSWRAKKTWRKWNMARFFDWIFRALDPILRTGLSDRTNRFQILSISKIHHHKRTKPSAEARLNKNVCITFVRFLDCSNSNEIWGSSGFSPSKERKLLIMSLVRLVSSYGGNRWGYLVFEELKPIYTHMILKSKI